MQPLNLPPMEPRLRGMDGHVAIYDPLRRRYVALTPEEWVRQHFTHFLIHHKGYPAALLANEISLRVGSHVRRCDTVLYRREGGQPQLIVEYKAPGVPITQAVFTQVSAYNSVLRADYLIVSNGLRHYCCHIDYARQAAEYLPDIPAYAELKPTEGDGLSGGGLPMEEQTNLTRTNE